jgi:hypothetical protein
MLSKFTEYLGGLKTDMLLGLRIFEGVTVILFTYGVWLVGVFAILGAPVRWMLG